MAPASAAFLLDWSNADTIGLHHNLSVLVHCIEVAGDRGWVRSDGPGVIAPRQAYPADDRQMTWLNLFVTIS